MPAAVIEIPRKEAARSAIPPPKIPEERNAPLDGIRGIAVLAVMAFHVWQDVPARTAMDRLVAGVLGVGWTGVDLFFVLSGFLITRILYEARSSPHYFRSFYARRMLRTFPLYYAGLFAVLAVPALLGRRLVEENPWWFLFHSSNIMTVLEGYPRRIVVHFWSLSIEEQFYLFWPVAIWLCRTRERMLKLCLGLIVTALALRAGWWFAGHAKPYQIYNFTLTRMDSLATGGLLALWLAGGPAASPARRLRILGATAALAAVAVAVSLGLGGPNHLRWTAWGQTIGFTAVAAGCACLIGWSRLADAGGRLNRMLGGRWLVFFGQYSYAMYIFHIWVDSAARAAGIHPAVATVAAGSTAGTTLPMIVYFGGFLAVTAAVAVASWHLLEKRFLALKQHFSF